MLCKPYGKQLNKMTYFDFTFDSKTLMLVALGAALPFALSFAYYNIKTYLNPPPATKKVKLNLLDPDNVPEELNPKDVTIKTKEDILAEKRPDWDIQLTKKEFKLDEPLDFPENPQLISQKLNTPGIFEFNLEKFLNSDIAIEKKVYLIDYIQNCHPAATQQTWLKLEKWCSDLLERALSEDEDIKIILDPETILLLNHILLHLKELFAQIT